MSGPKPLLFLLLLLAACRPPDGGESDANFLAAMNRGKAQLENKDSAKAVAAFTRATKADPRAASAWRNLARAQLLARDADAALAALAEAAGLESESTATSYLTGLAQARDGRFTEAIPHFEEAVRLDPHTPALRFQLANAQQAAGQHDEAIEQLREAVRLDPLHTSAHYKLSIYAQRSGDRQEAELRRRELVRLRALFGDENRTAEALETCVYTLAEAVTAKKEPPAAIPVTFADATAEILPREVHDARAVAVAEIDENGLPTLLAVSPAGDLLRLDPGAEGGFDARPLDVAIDPPAGPLHAITGNVYDEIPADVRYDPALHAHHDVLFAHPEVLLLFRAHGDGSFDDVTDAAGLSTATARRARFIDAEADGDLDLAVAADDGLALWQNNGNGTFSEVTAELGLELDTPLVDAAVADLDGDVVLDLAVAGESATHVFHNQRTGRFAAPPDPPGPWPAARRVLLDDLDADGRPDAVLVQATEVVIVPGRGERQRLELTDFEATAAALLDFDNDGFLDLLLGGEGLRLWRNSGGAFTEVGLGPIELSPVFQITPADLDGDFDTDVLLTTATGLAALRNDGGNANGQLKLRLRGTKTNPSGLGSRVEVRNEDFFTSRTVSALPIEIGLGAIEADVNEEIDSILTVWTNGIVDNEIGRPAAGVVLTVEEKNVASGSCPFLYAWDGTDFRFVTDLLGNSPLGLSLSRGVPLDADPDEIVEIGPAEIFPPVSTPEGDRFLLQVTEEMREVLYLDTARLWAVDHPSEVEIHPTDKLMPAPFPPSELWGLADPRPPRRAMGDDGVDRTTALAMIDGDHAPPGLPRPPPLRGQTRHLTLELDFGPLGDLRRPVLALTGWLQYGDASTNIALSQGAAEVIPPRLEMEDAAGHRRPLDVVVGMPAGKTKTILVDLEGHLTPDVRRLFLTTTFEIRWDRAVLADRWPADAIRAHELAPRSADLQFRGFSEIRQRSPGHPTTPRFSAARENPPWRTALSGFLTRYGDVGELIDERDGRLALVGAGDALALAFDATELPPPAAGMKRTFFFYSVGWDKDGDANVIDGDTVEPLPVTASEDGWRVEYNTRFVPWDRFARR